MTRLEEPRLVRGLAQWVCSVALCAAATLAQAEIVYQGFTGALDEGFGSLAAGTRFTGTFAYDTEQDGALSVPSSGPGVYRYLYMSLNIGNDMVYDAGPGQLRVYDMQTTPYPTDLLHLYPFALNASVGGVQLTPGAGLQIMYQDLAGTALNGLAPPPAGLSVSSFTGQGATFIQLQGATAAEPDFYQFARGSLDGTSNPGEASNPIMPIKADTQNGFGFDIPVKDDAPIFIDPVIALGYDYLLTSAGHMTSFTLPVAGDNQYELSLWDGTRWQFSKAVSGGVQYRFDGAGVDRFRILGIEDTAQIDAQDPGAFVTAITFEGSNRVTVSMTPITAAASVPEPESVALALAGLGVIWLASAARMRRHPPTLRTKIAC
jgi:hypothetical protein